MKAIELFCGIGGFRRGLAPVGIKTVFANDINENALSVYESNFGPTGVCHGDIHQIPLEEIPQHELLSAGFPCQPFSPAGKKQGVMDATNGTLFKNITEIIKHRSPKYFILENVRRMLSMQNGEHFHIILSALSSLDYSIEWRLINSVHLEYLSIGKEYLLLVKDCLRELLWSPQVCDCQMRQP